MKGENYPQPTMQWALDRWEIVDGFVRRSLGEVVPEYPERSEIEIPAHVKTPEDEHVTVPINPGVSRKSLIYAFLGAIMGPLLYEILETRERVFVPPVPTNILGMDEQVWHPDLLRHFRVVFKSDRAIVRCEKITDRRLRDFGAAAIKLHSNLLSGGRGY